MLSHIILLIKNCTAVNKDKRLRFVVQICPDIVKMLWYVVVLKGVNIMARVLLTSGNAFKRTDNRWV
jgi:hypothetical protein